MNLYKHVFKTLPSENVSQTCLLINALRLSHNISLTYTLNTKFLLKVNLCQLLCLNHVFPLVLNHVCFPRHYVWYAFRAQSPAVRCCHVEFNSCMRDNLYSISCHYVLYWTMFVFIFSVYFYFHVSLAFFVFAWHFQMVSTWYFCAALASMPNLETTQLFANISFCLAGTYLYIIDI